MVIKIVCCFVKWEDVVITIMIERMKLKIIHFFLLCITNCLSKQNPETEKKNNKNNQPATTDSKTYHDTYVPIQV